MTVTTAVVQVSAATSTGLQSITTTKLGGLTPKGAVFFMVRATSLDTAADNASICIGFTDGTDINCSSGASETAQATTDTYRHDSDTTVLSFLDPTGTASLDGTANLSGGGFKTNGIDINWVTAPGSAWLIVVLFFAGTDVSCHSNSRFDVSTSLVDITDVGFAPDMILFATAGNLSADSINNQGRICFAAYDGTTQACQALNMRDNQSDARNAMRISTDSVGLHIGNTGSLVDDVAASAIDSSGFSLSPNTASWSNRFIGYLAISFGGAGSVDAQTYDTSTTGTPFDDANVTGMGFTPEAGIMFLNNLQLRDTGNSGAGSEAFAIGVFDGTDEFSIGTTDDDGPTTSDSQSLVATGNAEFEIGTGSTAYAGVLKQFDSGGWTTTFATTTGNVNTWFALGFEGVAAVGGATPKNPLGHPLKGAFAGPIG